MILLAIDTALENCSVGLSIDGRLVLREQAIGRGHAERLMPQLAGLLAEAGLSMADIDRIAVSIGPGSFTGLRVGISAARGLALVGGTPVVGVSTLAAHAFHASDLRREAGGPADRPILALLPARGEELYGQTFADDASPLGAALVLTRDDVRERLRQGGLDLAGAGAALPGDGPAPIHLLSAPFLPAVIGLGLSLDPAGHPPRPLYVKPPDAAPASGAIARR